MVTLSELPKKKGVVPRLHVGDNKAGRSCRSLMLPLPVAPGHAAAYSDGPRVDE